MTGIRALAVVLLAAFVVSAEDKKLEFDAKAVLGKWTFTSGMKAGEKSEIKDLKEPLDVTADKMTLKTPDATFVFKYSADAKADPVAVELEILEPEGFKGAKSKGIVWIEKDVMKLAYNPKPDGDRPKDFKSTKENGNHVYEMKKVKNDEK